MGHVWGGGVYDYNGISLRMTDYVSYHDPDNDYIRQFVVFQDGKIAYSWFQKGAFCLSGCWNSATKIEGENHE